MSTLKVNTLEEATIGGATYFTAKAWCFYQQIGTSSIINDGGCSSISDLGTGQATISFDNTLSTVNYGVVSHVHQDPQGTTQSSKYLDSIFTVTRSTGSLRLNTTNDSSSTTSSADMNQADFAVML
jgi:hypothetical protein